jgi:ABC-type antimicrobial peptide transport system permease subunit
MLQKRYLLLLAAIVVAVTLATSLLAGGAGAGTGNNLPSGTHFTLNIHGVAKNQAGDYPNGFNGNNKSDIFAPLWGNCNIDLFQSTLTDPFVKSFQVLQPDCVNDPPAEFELPAPCSIDPTSGLCTSTTTFYSVYAAGLGSPQNNPYANITTCATPTGETQYICSLNTFVAVVPRNSGKPGWDNVSKDLLFLTVCQNGVQNSFPLFSDKFFDYFWQYDNFGLRLAQLRFYQVPSPVPTSGNSC